MPLWIVIAAPPASLYRIWSQLMLLGGETRQPHESPSEDAATGEPREANRAPLRASVRRRVVRSHPRAPARLAATRHPGEARRPPSMGTGRPEGARGLSAARRAM